MQDAVNIQKSVAFLYRNDELSKREINETIPNATTFKIIKYLEINLSKDVKDLYSKNYKTVVKKIWRWWYKEMERYQTSWIGKINIADNIILLHNAMCLHDLTFSSVVFEDSCSPMFSPTLGMFNVFNFSHLNVCSVTSLKF